MKRVVSLNDMSWSKLNVHGQMNVNKSKRHASRYVDQYMCRYGQTHAMHRKVFSANQKCGLNVHHLLPHAFNMNSSNIMSIKNKILRNGN